jgi:hypothetical protein
MASGAGCDALVVVRRPSFPYSLGGVRSNADRIFTARVRVAALPSHKNLNYIHRRGALAVLLHLDAGAMALAGPLSTLLKITQRTSPK